MSNSSGKVGGALANLWHKLEGHAQAKLQVPNQPNGPYPPSALDKSGNITEANAQEVINSWGTDFNDHMKAPLTQAQYSALSAEVRNDQAGFAAQQKRAPLRAMHTKGVFATGVTFQVSKNLPEALAYGPFKPGAAYKGVVRFSNGKPENGNDLDPDRRGLAFRIEDKDGHDQDFLMVSGAEAFVAKDGAAAVKGLTAELAGGSRAGAEGQVAAAESLTHSLVELRGPAGVEEAAKMMVEQRKTCDQGKSLAANTYYSRTPYQLGEHLMKFRLVPLDTNTGVQGTGPDALRQDLRARLAKGPVTYALQVKGYLNNDDTPVADGRAEWSTKSQYITLATLTIPQQNISEADAQKALEAMNKLSFSPWHRWDSNRDEVMLPKGPVNDVRKGVYEASAAGRGSGAPATLKCPLGYG
jgi:hypothetical protein